MELNYPAVLDWLERNKPQPKPESAPQSSINNQTLPENQIVVLDAASIIDWLKRNQMETKNATDENQHKNTTAISTDDQKDQQLVVTFTSRSTVQPKTVE